MAIDLDELAPLVRSSLSDIPNSFLTDDQLTNELDKANVFCNAIVAEDTAESYLEKCIVVVATYYAYVNYTSLAEKQIGTLPPSSAIRVKELRTIAVSFLSFVSAVPITSDLLMDTEKLNNSRISVLALTPTDTDYRDSL